MHSSGRRLGRLLAGAAVIAATGVFVPTAATAAPAGTTGPIRRTTWSSSRGRPARPTPRPTSPARAARSSRTTRRSACSSRAAATRPSRSAAGEQQGRGRVRDGEVRLPAGRRAGADADAQPRATCRTRRRPTATRSRALQWDMRQIHTPEAHAITGGSPAVSSATSTPGSTTPTRTCAPNVDVANSANCVSGAPVPGTAAANDDNGHGTHTAGTIAAAANGIGIVGVAPNVKIAGIKAGNAAGFFFPEAVICAFMWAGDARHRRDEQQLLRRPVAVQLQERPGAAGDLEGRAAGDQVRPEAGRAPSSPPRATTATTCRTRRRTSRARTTRTPVRRVTITNACVVVPVEVSGRRRRHRRPAASRRTRAPGSTRTT